MVLYGNQGHFREAGRGGQSQILDPTCNVYFRNYFRRPYTANTSDTWLKGKNMYFSHKRAQKQQEVEKVRPARRKSCLQLTERMLTPPGKQVLGKG